MDFEINENQQMIAQMVRDFAEKEIRPNINQWDHEEHFPVDVMKKMGELGLMGIYIPEEKIGIRIENDLIVGKDGPIDLMKNIPFEVEEIETLMNE